MMWTALCVALATAAQTPSPLPPLPRVHDARLKIELFAAEPDIATPTGLAVDARGRVLVVESHTHFRPDNYAGPPADRIRMFEDADGDGRAERITDFFEGTTWTMNLGIHPDGSVYVATRSEIFRLRDRDDDGRADERTRIAHLETSGDYPHNGLSGFAFDFAGNVYFGLGENKGAEFKLIGTDGSMASELEGGQIYRCRPDGSHVELVAFGFWNPFHLAFDTFGRLFAVDNDPDSLPPCRLMHIVPGGNYGYRYRNGRRGVHPFTAWNGEIPGTLPMVAGTGEAPSGIVAYESDQLPAEYRGELLVTSWGDHRVDRFHLEPRGASFRADPTTVVSGDENFRPVGIAVAPDGSLFVSDWVLKDYQVHGKGRLWHLRAAKPVARSRPENDLQAIASADRPTREQAARRLATNPKTRSQLTTIAAKDDSARTRAAALDALAGVDDRANLLRSAREEKLPAVRAQAISLLAELGQPIDPQLLDLTGEPLAAALRGTTDAQSAKLLWQRVADRDAFVAQAARQGLIRSGAVSASIDSSGLSPAERLAWLLMLRETRDPAGRQLLSRFLTDPDKDVRFAAIQWVGEERLAEYRAQLRAAIDVPGATARLFGGYLAALERIDGAVRESSDEWGLDQYVARALEQPNTTPEVRRWALRVLRPDHPVLDMERLRQYLNSDDAALRLEAVRSLRDSTHDEREALLAEIAADEKRPIELRAEAIVGLSGDTDVTRKLLVALACGDQPELRDEALRSLRAVANLNAAERNELSSAAQRYPDAADLVARVLDRKETPTLPPVEDVDAWLRLIDEGAGGTAANRAAGERIFFHRQAAGCARCHQIEGRGGRIGPELTAAGGALSRRRLMESILRPSKEISPQFATWQIVTTDGRTLSGVLVHEQATGEQTYADVAGKTFVLKPHEIESRRLLATSIMPEGLPRLMTMRELRDLLGYLQPHLKVDGEHSEGGKTQ